jgi:hypothetical protein
MSFFPRHQKREREREEAECYDGMHHVRPLFAFDVVLRERGTRSDSHTYTGKLQTPLT